MEQIQRIKKQSLSDKFPICLQHVRWFRFFQTIKITKKTLKTLKLNILTKNTQSVTGQMTARRLTRYRCIPFLVFFICFIMVLRYFLHFHVKSFALRESRRGHLAAGTRRLGGSEALRLWYLILGNFLELLDCLLKAF